MQRMYSPAEVATLIRQLSLWSVWIAFCQYSLVCLNRFWVEQSLKLSTDVFNNAISWSSFHCTISFVFFSAEYFPCSNLNLFMLQNSKVRSVKRFKISIYSKYDDCRQTWTNRLNYPSINEHREYQSFENFVSSPFSLEAEGLICPHLHAFTTMQKAKWVD